MRCALVLLVGVLAAASAQQQDATDVTHDAVMGIAEFRGGHRHPSYHDYHDHYHGYYGPPRRRPYYPVPYDEHRYPENHPAYYYGPNRPTNYLPNYYNYPSRNPTQYEFASYWYPTGPGPYPNTNPWYSYPPRRG